MFKVTNKTTNEAIFNGDEDQFIKFVKKLVIKNKDYDYSVLGIGDAIEYIEYFDEFELEYE